MTPKIIWAAAIIILLIPSAGGAQSSHLVNVALVNPIQIFPEQDSIIGFRLNFLYGYNAAMVGMDWGLVNHVGADGLFGSQEGVVNIVDGDIAGMQGGVVNLGNRNVRGFQYGVFNRGDHVNGFQLGLVNSAGTMRGLQIGLLNFIKTGGKFPVFPIVNWSF